MLRDTVNVKCFFHKTVCIAAYMRDCLDLTVFFSLCKRSIFIVLVELPEV